jgi:hypothetical protein
MWTESRSIIMAQLCSLFLLTIPLKAGKINKQYGLYAGCGISVSMEQGEANQIHQFLNFTF